MITLLAGLAFLTAHMPPTDHWVYIGTFGPGIYVSKFSATGELSKPEMVARIGGPGFLAKHHNLPIVYAIGDRSGKAVVSAFQINAADGKLTLLNEVPAGNGGDAYISVANHDEALFTANYGEGSVSSFKLLPDGRIGEKVSFYQQQGKGIVEQQSGPHAHCINEDPSGRFVLDCDLGADKVFVYRFDSKTAKLTPNDPSSVSLTPGDGPRHLVFSKDGRTMYSVNELGGSVTRFNFNRRTGILVREETVSTLPPDYKGRGWCAEISLDASGRHLYASNRADDESIAVFDVGRGGVLKMKQVYRGGIHHPRHFTLDPSGGYLFIGNLEGGNVTVASVDPETGMLSPASQVAQVRQPACILFW